MVPPLRAEVLVHTGKDQALRMARLPRAVVRTRKEAGALRVRAVPPGMLHTRASSRRTTVTLRQTK